MRLEQLFDVRNGIASSGLTLSLSPRPGYIPYLRPASTQQRTITGWVPRSEVGKQNIYPAGTMFVSTNGEGSHSYSYVSSFEFACNSDVSVLLPKRDMSLREKMFYARCITMNRHRFSYGRKPKGDRLKQIELPEIQPSWINSGEGAASLDFSASCIATPTPTPKLQTEYWQPFEYQQLFDIDRGTGPRRKDLDGTGATPFVTSSDSNNGVTGVTSMPPTHKGNTIGVNRNGSVAEAFYHPLPFCSTEDVHIFTPKFQLNPYIALFLTTLIRQEKYRFGYGRKWGIERMKKSVIKLPVTKTGEPDWSFMENYIKSLPYSSHIR